jgi:hypothetical protein
MPMMGKGQDSYDPKVNIYVLKNVFPVTGNLGKWFS